MTKVLLSGVTGADFLAMLMRWATSRLHAEEGGVLKARMPWGDWRARGFTKMISRGLASWIPASLSCVYWDCANLQPPDPSALGDGQCPTAFHPTAIHHLPPFITAQESDMLFDVAVIFMIRSRRSPAHRSRPDRNAAGIDGTRSRGKPSVPVV